MRIPDSNPSRYKISFLTSVPCVIRTPSSRYFTNQKHTKKTNNLSGPDIASKYILLLIAERECRLREWRKKSVGRPTCLYKINRTWRTEITRQDELVPVAFEVVLSTVVLIPVGFRHLVTRGKYHDSTAQFCGGRNRSRYIPTNETLRKQF